MYDQYLGFGVEGGGGVHFGFKFESFEIKEI